MEQQKLLGQQQQLQGHIEATAADQTRTQKEDQKKTANNHETTENQVNQQQEKLPPTSKSLLAPCSLKHSSFFNFQLFQLSAEVWMAPD